MKVFTKVIVVLCILSLPFSVLYFVKPRVVTKKVVVDKVVSTIPDTSSVSFKPSPPDVVFRKKNTIVSLKTFNKDILLGRKRVARVSSKVSVYSHFPIDSIGNKVSLYTDRYALRAYLYESTQSVFSEKEKRSFRRGLMIGGCAAAILVSGAFLLARRGR